MEFEAVMLELESLGNDRIKRRYIGNGAHEPLFGVATGAMKPMAKQIKRDQALAERLYKTGNYDAMYFAGVIADPDAMSARDFDRWMDSAYFFMLSDFVVAVTLAEAEIAQQVADTWIASGEELRMSGGWACYEWLLGSRKDAEFDPEKIRSMLHTIQSTIHTMPNRTRYAMNGFLMAAGISYLPMHDEALLVAQAVGKVSCQTATGECAVAVALDEIQAAQQKNRLGFKRKNVRC